MAPSADHLQLSLGGAAAIGADVRRGAPERGRHPAPAGAAPGQAVRVCLQTDAFAGPQLVHCHNLDHSDGGQMLLVGPAGADGTSWEGARRVDPACARAASGVGPPALICDTSRYLGDAYPRRFPIAEVGLWRPGAVTGLGCAGGAGRVLLLAILVGRLAVRAEGRAPLAPHARAARPVPMLSRLWPRRPKAVVYSHMV
jgi:hypothetical protein